MPIQLAVDIGGTFTDLVALNTSNGEISHAKSSSSHGDLTQGIFECIRKSGVSLEDAEIFVHGATVAINTLIERKGSRTVLVTTRGIRDAYLIGRGNRPEAFNVFFQRPEPLVERELIVEVTERLSATGEVLQDLEQAEIDRIVAAVSNLRPEAVAVCLLHAYINPSHEQRIGEAIRRAMPDTYLSLSHQILRRHREYERTSTTVVNSYVGPTVGRYLQELATRSAERGFGGTLLIMQSNGGVTRVASAAEAPVALMESGPVGGISASAEIARRLGYPSAISFDMGGTTAKASLIKNGEPTIAEGYYVGGYASGHPVLSPVVDIIEVGAGGGSIGWIDELGAMRVGPQSAGSMPGPVCYRTGGVDPTVTDANLVLGRIDGSNFLGGEMKLDVEAARAAIASRLSGPLGLTVEEAAFGILRIAIAHMTLAVRGVSIERGHDPRDFVLIASGGNGGLHAPLIARELNIPTVILPILPGHCSATGMLMTDIRHDYVQSLPAAFVDQELINRALAEFTEQGSQLLVASGVEVSRRRFMAFLDMRYAGQEYTLSVPLDREEMEGEWNRIMTDRFHALHRQNYGQEAPDESVEIVAVRLVALGVRDKLPLKQPHSPTFGVPTWRKAYLTNPKSPEDCAVYSRDSLAIGQVVVGPALIEEQATTLLLLPDDRAEVIESGEIVVRIGGGAK